MIISIEEASTTSSNVPLLVVGALVFGSLLLAFVLGWNNSGLTTGNLSNLVTYSVAVTLTVVGMFAGYFIEGPMMTHSILGKLIVTEMTSGEIASAVAVSLIFFLALTIVKIPVSLSNCVVGAFVGVALASNVLISSISLIKIIASWLIAPFFCMGVAIFIYEVVTKSESSISLPSVSWINRLILLGTVFYVSYALAANNGGMILSFMTNSGGIGTVFSSTVQSAIEIGIIAGIALGMVLFGKSLAKVVGDKIVGLSQIKTLAAMLAAAFVVWLFTQFSIPVSLTQVVIGGMLGAGFSRGPALVNRRELVVMISYWVLVTLLCVIVGFGTEYVIVRYGIF